MLDSENLEFDYLNLENNEIFLSGEAHGVGINKHIARELLFFLYREAEVRYFLFEGGFALGDLINRYIRGEEDEHLLNTLMIQLEGSVWHSAEQAEFWRDLREFNAQLPPEEHLEVVGFDLELPLTSVVLYLDYLLPPEIPGYLNPIGELARKYREIEDYKERYSSKVRFEVTGFNRLLQEVIKENRQEMKGILGGDFEDFSQALKSLDRTLKSWGGGERAREENSFESLLEFEKRLERGNIFGQWGGDHILQKSRRGMEWLGSRLNESESPWAGKVLSLYFIYDNCKRLDPVEQEVVFYNSSEIRDLPTLRRAVEGDLTLFNLTGEASPFWNWPYLLTRHSGGGTADYFQYILYIRNQPASRPWSEEKMEGEN